MPVLGKHDCAYRHMYTVLQRRPTVREAKIRWHNGYAHEYGVIDSSLKYFELQDKFAYPGVPITVEDVAWIKKSMKVGEGNRLLKFSEETLGKLRLCEGMKGSHRAKVRDTLPKHIPQCIPCDSCGEDDNSMSNQPEEEDVQEALAGEPDEATSAAGLAGNQHLSGRSSYAVPSQAHQVYGVIDLAEE